MITLNGATGKGCLWGTFYLRDRLVSDRGYCTYSHLDYLTPPCDWFLPPPSSLWSPVGLSPYGPRQQELLVGDIQSVSNSPTPWNPCKHTNLKGDMNYTGLNGENSPYWSIMAASGKTSFTACDDSMFQPKPQGTFVSAMIGRPAKLGAPAVYSNLGSKINQVLTTSNDADKYWNVNSTLCANIAPPSIRSTLSQFGQLHRNGYWYCRQINGLLVTNPVQQVHYYKTNWIRPDRATFVRDQYVEYHTTSSYTPEASVGESGYGSLVELNHRVTTCKITHVRSDSPGRFLIRYNQTTDLSWYGYSYGDGYFKGSKTETINGLVTSLLVTEPGKTAEVIFSTASADKYCGDAAGRAAMLYDAADAESARTSAVRDVQELDSNWIENLAGIKGTLDVIKPLLLGWKAVQTGDLDAARKALAGAYLSYKYVIKPALRDVKDVRADGSQILNLATVNRFSIERRRGASVRTDVPVSDTKATLSYFTTLHLKLKDSFFSEIWQALEKLGLDPTAGQLWDLIPFSFVVDWFVPLGDALKTVDQYNSLVLNRDVLSRIESFKVQWPVGEDDLKEVFTIPVCFSGSPLEYSWYDRRVYNSVGQIDPLSVNSDNNGLTASQMTQGTALLTQMMR